MKKKVMQTIPQLILAVVAISSTGFLTACGGGVSAERLAGSWECNSSGRSSYDFDIAGKYVQTTLGNPNSADSATRATTEVRGTFGIMSGRLTLTPTRILTAVEPQDFLAYFQLANISGKIRHVGGTTFEISPGDGYMVMNATISGKSLTLRVTERVDAKGQEVNLSNVQPFECSKD